MVRKCWVQIPLRSVSLSNAHAWFTVCPYIRGRRRGYSNLALAFAWVIQYVHPFGCFRNLIIEKGLMIGLVIRVRHSERGSEKYSGKCLPFIYKSYISMTSLHESIPAILTCMEPIQTYKKCIRRHGAGLPHGLAKMPISLLNKGTTWQSSEQC